MDAMLSDIVRCASDTDTSFITVKCIPIKIHYQSRVFAHWILYICMLLNIY